MQTLSDLLIKVASFPELYLGAPSLERLCAFIGGFLHANKDADDGCLDGFNDYIYNRYNINTDHNWSEIIRFFSNNDPQAFDFFIEHFNDFSAQSGRPELVLRLDRNAANHK